MPPSRSQASDPRPSAFIRGFSLLALAAALSGCTSTGKPGPVQVSSGSYQAAFDAAKESLRDLNFQLDRIDAAAGVITTKSKDTGGLMTPWDTEQSSAAQEWEDMLNQQSRLVRVSFLPADPAADTLDLRDYSGPVVANIDVVVIRTNRPNWRVQPRSVLSSRFARDPVQIDRGFGGAYDVPSTRDTRLADRLADEIRDRMAEPPKTSAQ